MSVPTTSTVLQRIDQLLATSLPGGKLTNQYAAVSEALQGTLTLAVALYGRNSPQVITVTGAVEKARQSQWAVSHAFIDEVWPVVFGTLRSMRQDVESGLIGDFQRRAVGEVIADMLALAKEALAERSDGAKNVAAVLAAAAYEDTIRRMGDSLGGISERPDLSEVITALKRAGMLVGAPLTTALGYLKFRNDALHADWAKINHAVVGSCIAFVEGLILERFS